MKRSICNPESFHKNEQQLDVSEPNDGAQQSDFQIEQRTKLSLHLVETQPLLQGTSVTTRDVTNASSHAKQQDDNIMIESNDVTYHSRLPEAEEEALFIRLSTTPPPNNYSRDALRSLRRLEDLNMHVVEHDRSFILSADPISRQDEKDNSTSKEEEADEKTGRQRAHSEPDASRIRNLFQLSSSRTLRQRRIWYEHASSSGFVKISAVGGLSSVNSNNNNPNSHVRSHALSVPATIALAEPGRTSFQLPSMIADSVDSILSSDTGSRRRLGSASSSRSLAWRSSSALEEDNPETVPPTNSLATTSSANSNSDETERLARIRWIRINRRFQVVITIVALLFSLLLFTILICWVVLTSAFVVSMEKQCDLPLRTYYWLVTVQLVLDVFRNDIMRFVFDWDSRSSQRIPRGVIAYNVAYLCYAVMVLSLGIRSTYMNNDEFTCKDTAPDLFNASIAFVSLSIAAWATIICGYLIPFFVVAILLTLNGYNPATDVPGSGLTPQAVFPAAYSTSGAPSGCIDALSVIPVHSITSDENLECCICMEEFRPNDVAVETKCRHVFHESCCREWLRQARTCPVCRDDIPSALGIDFRNRVDQNSTYEMSPIGMSPNARQMAGMIQVFRVSTRQDLHSEPCEPSRITNVSDEMEEGRNY